MKKNWEEPVLQIMDILGGKSPSGSEAYIAS